VIFELFQFVAALSLQPRIIDNEVRLQSAFLDGNDPGLNVRYAAFVRPFKLSRGRLVISARGMSPAADESD